MADERNPEIDDQPKKYTARQDFEGTTFVDPGGTEHTGSLGGGSGSDADTLDGQDGTHYLDHTNFTNLGAADHHAKYTNAEAVAAVNAENALDVDISGDADTLDGDHFDDRLRNQRSFHLQSGSGTEIFEIGQISSTDDNADVNVCVDLPFNGPTSGDPCHTRVYINGRGVNAEPVVEWSQFGPETDIRGEVIVTQGADNHVHLYVRANGFLNTTVRVEYGREPDNFNFQGGVGSMDGIPFYDMSNQSPSLTADFGDITKNGNELVTSGSTEYEIQKDGTDGAGIINFKTQ